jgi:hypothetical protein
MATTFAADVGRSEAILARLSAGERMRDVGADLGISGERVRQIANAALAGRPLPRRYITVPELAARHGRKHAFVYYRLERAGLTLGGRRPARFPLAMLPELEAALATRVCVVCGQPVLRKFCSRVCSYAAATPRTVVPAAAGNLGRNGGLRDAYEAVKGVAPGECFVPFAAGVAAAGVTQTRFWWMVRRSVIATRDHPTKKAHRTGLPMKLYSLAQAEAVGRRLARLRATNRGER